MFRYIAFAWHANSPSAAAASLRLGQAINAQPTWQQAFAGHGLQVFITGARRGVNEAVVLPDAAGVLLGKVFRRTDLGHEQPAGFTPTREEARHIGRSGGQALIADYWGRYIAFLARDPAGTLILRDPSGALPCFHMQFAGVTIIFSWLEDVLTSLPCIPAPSVDWQGLAEHILYRKIGGRGTALEGTRKLLPGEALAVEDGAVRPRLLWNAADIARQATSLTPAQAAPQLRATVRACARAWASCHARLLLRLSGGVDSSILLSCLDEDSTPATVICVNYHSAGPDSDERAYARLAAARAKRLLVERERDQGFRLEHALDVARTPEPSSYVGRAGIGRLDAALARQHHAEAVFTGGGGDQLFFELRGCWPAADYLHTRGLNAGFLAALLDAARLGRVSVWRALRLVLASRLTRTQPWDAAGTHLTLIDPGSLPRHGVRGKFLHPALRSGDHLPAGKARQAMQLLVPLDYYDPYQRESAPEMVNPLLSQPVIELCLRLPTYVLTHGGQGRGLARQAFAADLPVEIARRRTKGSMGNHLRLMLHRSSVLARSLLLEGELVHHGLLDRAKVEQAMSSMSTTSLAQHYEIHACLGIEAWLQRWSRGSLGRSSMSH